MADSQAIPTQGTVLAISTGSGGAKTITGIALGYPTIITSTAHGFVAGDVVTLAGLTGANANVLNGNSYVVKNRTVNTFAIEANTLGLTITAAGTATPASFTDIAEVKSFSGLDGSSSEIDVTHLGSTAKEFRLGLKDEGGFSFEISRVQGDPGQTAVFASRDNSTVRTYRLTFPNNETVAFSALAKTVTVSGGVDGVLAHSVTLRVSAGAVWS